MNPNEIFPGGGGIESVLILLAALAAFLNVVLVYRIMIERDPVAPRIRAINDRMRELKEGITRPRAHRRRREQSIGFMRQVVRRLNLLKTR